MLDWRLPGTPRTFLLLGVIVFVIGASFFSIFSTREATLLFAGLLGGATLIAFLIRASRRDDEP